MHLETILSYIVWDPMREIIKGIEPPVWYSVLFAAGFIIGYQIMIKIFKTENHNPEDVDVLTVHMVLATVLGARFGHLAFYEPERWLADPFMFFRIWEGGLASHGAAIGILIALYLYSNYSIIIGWTQRSFKKRKRKGQSYLWTVDRVVITVALAGAFIRFGNFVNSEIIGKPTESDYGVVFGRVAEEYLEDSNIGIASAEASKGSGEALSPGIVPVTLTLTFEDQRISEPNARILVENQVKNILSNSASINEHYVQKGDLDYELTLQGREFVAVIHTYGISRHPSQLYEAGTCIILFIILLGLWFKLKGETPEGLLTGIFMVWIFGFRWFHEIFKENQVAFEDDLSYNLGQILSIPLVAIGVGILISVYMKRKKT